MGNTLAKPSVQQIRWLENERAMFVHLDPSTWTGKEIDDHTANLSDIKLEKLNTDQWCEAALAWGAGAIIFVAKHVGGSAGGRRKPRPTASRKPLTRTARAICWRKSSVHAVNTG